MILTTKNEESSIGPLLDSLLSQSRVPDEIVIADGGSTDGTVAIIERYIRSGHPVRLIMATGTCRGAGRNRAIEAARGRLVALTDAGTIANPRWLENLLEPFPKDPQVDVVYGAYEPVTHTLFEECAAIAYIPANVTVDGRRIRSRSVVSAMIKKHVWECVGGFPEGLGTAEDLIFMNRLSNAAAKVAFAPDAVVYWNIPPDFRRTFRRFATYSQHGLSAGFAKTWHLGVFRIYLASGILMTLAVVHSPWWGLLLLALFTVRIVKCFQQQPRAGSTRMNRLSPRRWLLVLLIRFTIDAATFYGAIQWLVSKLKTGLVDKTE